MSGIANRLNEAKSAPRPFLLAFNWPEPVALSKDTIRAAIFGGIASKEGYDGLLVREDDRFLGFENLGKAWRLTSGDFVGDGSTIGSIIVRTDESGHPIAPKKSFVLRLMPGNNGAECTWQEALGVALNFADFGRLPPGLVWWSKPVDPQ